MSKHTSINVCEDGVDFLMTDHETGKIKLLQWNWRDVEEFILKHGRDATGEVGEQLDDFMAGAVNVMKDNLDGQR